MTLFWTMALSLLAMALAFIFVPLLRTRGSMEQPAQDSGTGTGLAIYRTQLAELDADRQNGVISEAQFSAARVDLQHSLLEMAANTGSGRRAGRSWRWPLGLTALVVLPVLAILIYQEFGGGPMALDPPRREVPQTATADDPDDADMIISALRERLDQSPDDPVGWALLGRVYHAMGQTRAAVQAYAQSVEHGGDQDPGILVDYADVLATATGGSLEGRPRELIRRALEIEPDHVMGLWLAGTAAFRAEAYAEARDHWRRLAGLLPPESQNGAIIRSNLIEVESRIAGQDTAGVEP